MEVMRFGGALLRILKQVLTADPHLETVYLSKVVLSEAYMRFWVRMEDVPSVTFLIPKKTPSNTQLVVFHLSFPMGYIDGAPYFVMATETVADLAYEAISQRDQEGEHPLDLAAEARAADDSGAPEDQSYASWEHLPVEQRATAKANFNVYLDNIISVVQRGPRERRQMLRRLFH